MRPSGAGASCAEATAAEGGVTSGGCGGVGDSMGADPPNLAMVSSANFIRRSVAFWKISSSLTMVGKILGRSGSVVLLAMSIRLILMGSRRGESIKRLMSVCLFS
ncbi:MAG: hypothetical protein UX38_C0004G0031 [Microgenomates group bacterium GW2011_GWC1_46_16]|nr:MAG: hypothetical protein UX38_C0004G0031 [Microgenomates group bacterium GW2011_GWC1_46_16]